MRIAVVNHHMRDVIGGSELQCHLVAQGLTERGHDVTYVAVDATPGAPAAASTALTYAVRPSVPDPGALADAILASGPDVVYWRFNRRGLREVAARLRTAEVPLVFAVAHVDDVTPWPSWPWPSGDAGLRDRASDLRSRLRRRREFAAFRDVSAIASQRRDLIGRIPRTTVDLQRHVPNMMDPSLADGPPFVHPRPFVAWVGNLKPRKRPELIPVLADALAPHGIDLVVVGPAQDAQYAWLTGPLEQHPNLVPLGALPTEAVVSVLASSRCLAVTAMPEGFSNVMIQAWWVGTPTVTLDYDPDGVVADEQLGAVADGDVARFVADVVRMASDPASDLTSATGARAAAWARAHFAPPAVLDALEQLIGDVVARGGAVR